jgi:hypothetical protein
MYLTGMAMCGDGYMLSVVMASSYASLQYSPVSERYWDLRWVAS